jgi:hypothetical protein
MGNLYSNNQAGQQALGNQAQSANAQQTGIRAAIQRVSLRNSEFSKCVADLREIIDRLVGSYPQDASKGSAPVGVPSGDLQALHAEIDDYDSMFVALGIEINRLSGL